MCVALALAAIGGATETVLESTDHRLDAPAGQTYDVAGHRMYLHCTGTGSPTVLLSNGFGERTPSWSWIASTVAATTRVCVYDRAGQGWSEAASGPQDGAQVAADLHATLAQAHVAGPYVLAGHSIGGIYNMIFAARYPTEVAGMVLLDSATPEQFTALPKYPSFYSTVPPRLRAPADPRPDRYRTPRRHRSSSPGCRPATATRNAPSPRPLATSAASATSGPNCPPCSTRPRR